MAGIGLVVVKKLAGIGCVLQQSTRPPAEVIVEAIVEGGPTHRAGQGTKNVVQVCDPSLGGIPRLPQM